MKLKHGQNIQSITIQHKLISKKSLHCHTRASHNPQILAFDVKVLTIEILYVPINIPNIKKSTGFKTKLVFQVCGLTLKLNGLCKGLVRSSISSPVYIKYICLLYKIINAHYFFPSGHHELILK